MKRRHEAPPEPLSQEDFDRMKCVHCGGAHMRACPRVKRMVFDERLNLLEVEFWPESMWEDEHVVWPESIYDGPTEESE